MRYFILLAAIAIAICGTAQRTTRSGLRPKAHAAESAAAVTLVYDTIVSPGSDIIDVKGYDKPLRSRRETFFATNNGSVPVRRMAFTISYYDIDRHLLHRASHNVEADIPAGEQRMVGVRSWDVQQAFYYTRTTVDHKSSKASPYDVEIHIDTLFAAAPLP